MNAQSVPNAYQPARDLSEDTDVCAHTHTDTYKASRCHLGLSVASVLINLLAVSLLIYTLSLVFTYPREQSGLFEVGVSDDKFTPLQRLKNVDVDTLPADATILLELQEDDTLMVRLYHVKSVQQKLDKDTGRETSRTFFLSMKHKLVLNEESAVLYDESGSNVLAKYAMGESSTTLSTAEESGAKELADEPQLRRMFLHEHLMTKKPIVNTNNYYNNRYPYGGGMYRPCSYCGMYGGSFGPGFPFGGGYPYGGMGGMGGNLGLF